MTDAESPSGRETSAEGLPSAEKTVCAHCKKPGPVGDDGFCDKCEGELEQTCL